ncbi:hypothetical protein B2A_05842, partial [mine drainage metagenome]
MPAEIHGGKVSKLVRRDRDRGEWQGVILAAGSASRMGFLGGILPKTMIPVGGKPLLWYGLKTLGSL